MEMGERTEGDNESPPTCNLKPYLVESLARGKENNHIGQEEQSKLVIQESKFSWHEGKPFLVS